MTKHTHTHTHIYIYIAKHAEKKELHTRVSVTLKASLHSWKLIRHRWVWGEKLSLHQETRYVGPGMVPFLLMQGQSLSIGELQLWWEYVINHVRNSGHTCSHGKKDKCLYGESQFDIELSKVLQLVHVWPTELWDTSEHNYFEKT